VTLPAHLRLIRRSSPRPLGMPQADDTPLMRQWREVKSRNRDSLVFFRVGDFYELFYGDAEEGSRLLGLTLTSRNNGAAARVPLAGVPAKALDDYLGRLVKLGQRVAICDQVEDPAEAKGIVRREVTETVTPGTVLQDTLLTAKRNNFLVALTEVTDQGVGVATLDLSTGEISAQAVPPPELRAELGRRDPTELLIPRSLEHAAEALAADAGAKAGDDTAAAREAAIAIVQAAAGVLRTYRDDWVFDYQTAADELKRRYGVQSLDAFGFQKDDGVLVRATGALLTYVGEIRPGGVEHLRTPQILRRGSAMLLDEMTRRNLELVEPMRVGEEGGTLISVLDETVTAMGARTLRRWLLHPLVDAEQIWNRQNAVIELFENVDLRERLREALGRMTDLERLAGKVGAGRVAPRELLGLGRSLAELPNIQEAGQGAGSDLLKTLVAEMDLLSDVLELVNAAVSPDAPATLQDGGVIREGYSEELDDLRATRDGARDFIASLQARERERTGITSLKVGFNRIFGYYLEVTKSNLDKVPDDYVRKQTLTNAERYFTPELKEWEEKVFGAEDRMEKIEIELFGDVRRQVASEVSRIQEAGARAARLDVLTTLAYVAERRQYVCPEMHTGFEVEIEGGRHPVVETMMPAEAFIPNDLLLDEGGRIVILTGPNMAGKSTVLRQIGLIHLMAQIGSFVPANRARLPVCDRIFTRVGASDNLARGQSTFMVEMNETASIIHGATDRSLVLLDEIGRGTSTYDGVSIAWAVTEHLHESVGCKTIFATHYHELTQLGDLLPGAKNMNVIVREVGEEIVFLRRLADGGADRYYGIQVARLAGLPADVIARARELLTELEGTHSGGGEGLGRFGEHRPAFEPPPDQLSFFAVAESPVVKRLRAVDPDTMTPREALDLLFELRKESGPGETE
jgi:DNA mismatch repair protein MutS